MFGVWLIFYSMDQILIINSLINPIMQYFRKLVLLKSTNDFYWLHELVTVFCGNVWTALVLSRNKFNYLQYYSAYDVGNIA